MRGIQERVASLPYALTRLTCTFMRAVSQRCHIESLHHSLAGAELQVVYIPSMVEII